MKNWKNLIIKIEENINISFKHKNKSTLGLICSWILVIAGIAVGIVLSGILNTFTAIRYKSTINES